MKADRWLNAVLYLELHDGESSQVVTLKRECALPCPPFIGFKLLITNLDATKRLEEAGREQIENVLEEIEITGVRYFVQLQEVQLEAHKTLPTTQQWQLAAKLYRWFYGFVSCYEECQF